MKTPSDNDHTGKLTHDNKLYLLILLIMLLVISQVIVLMASASSGLGTPPEHVSVNAPESVLNDIKTTNADFKEVAESIDDINAEPDELVVESDEKEPAKSETAKTVTQKKVIIEDIKPVQKNKKLTVIAVSPATNSDEISSVEIIVTATEVMPEYIKHDNNGDSLADDSENWSCVHDTTTGLMWEVKSQEDALRNSNNLYSWFDPARETLPGEQDGGRCKGDSGCDTNAYIQAMNENNYCGHNDWQLPTREQMQSLVDLKNDNDNVTINKQYFPNTMPSWYWTATDKKSNSEHAWYVLFRNGIALSDLKERSKHIRLVHEILTDNNGS